MTSQDEFWPAPTASSIDATVVVPGSKSQNNRELVLAALAAAPTTLRGALKSRDSDLMMDALRSLGIGVTEEEDTVTVTPAPLRGEAEVDCGLAGTVMRFIPPIAALADGPVTLDGDPHARKRPMAPVLDALRDLGVAVTSPAGGPATHLPVRVEGRGHLEGGEVAVDASGSSQFVSALLLAAPRYERGLTVRHVGERSPSVPHIDMTVAALRNRGVRVDVAENRWRVHPGEIAGAEIDIEPDLSNAGPFLAAALATGGRVRVPDWPSHTTQPGDLLRGFLTEMGATADLAAGTLTVQGPAVIHPLRADLSAAGELTPTLAALCTLAEGESVLTGIAHLRGHETDRLAALVTEITRLGAHAEELPDGIIIQGGASHLTGAAMETYDDHRMATFAAIIGLAVPGVRVRDIGTTAKTITDFPGLWQQMIGA